MRTSELVKMLSALIKIHGDLEIVIGYDGTQCETLPDVETNDKSETGNGGSFRHGPRNLVVDWKLDTDGSISDERCFRL